MFTSLDEICQKVKQEKKKNVIAMVCAEHEVGLQAVLQAKETGGLEHVLLGNVDGIKNTLRNLGEDPSDHHIISCETEEQAAANAVALAKGGEAQIIMKGNTHTSTLMKAILNKDDGIREGACLTNMALVEVPGYKKLLTISDGAVLVCPTLAQKEYMIRSISSRLFRMGYVKVKVSILAASEEISEKQPETVDAVKLKAMCTEGRFPFGVLVDGPLSFDLSVDTHSVEAKHYESEVAGDADVIITPNIVTANALVKALRLYAGARSAGMVLGAKVPVILSSRGASAKTKLISLLVAAASV